MASPVTVDDVKNAVPTGSGTGCSRFLAAIMFAATLYKWYAWMYREDGTFTETFKKELCAVRCACSGSIQDMSIPLPREFEALAVNPSDSICVALKKVFIQFPILFYKWYKAVYDDTNTFTDEFKSQICDAAPIS